MTNASVEIPVILAEELDSSGERCTLSVRRSPSRCRGSALREIPSAFVSEMPEDGDACDSDFSEGDYSVDEDRLLYVKGERRYGTCDGGIGSSTAQATSRIRAQLSHAISQQTSSGYSHAVKNSILKSEAKAALPRHRGLTRDTRATVEQVLDRRTLLLLEKLIKRQIFDHLFGCISAGKEANVYLGQCRTNASTSSVPGGSQTNAFRAVKVFRISILSFKDRARYVEGEFRFRRGYAGSGNPRKMVLQWAEKEFRNLRRIAVKGVRCPVPIELRGHVIAMSFLGDCDGNAAPRMKELIHANPPLPVTFWRRLYVEYIVTLRQLFQECKLIHGDFSEYNILFHMGHLYVIDVSQAVESDHPHALDFLKRDCVNVYQFFKKRLEYYGVTKSDGETGEGHGTNVSDDDSDSDENKTATKSDQRTTFWTDEMVRYVNLDSETLGAHLDLPFVPLSPQQLYYFVTNLTPCWTRNRTSHSDQQQQGCNSESTTEDDENTSLCGEHIIHGAKSKLDVEKTDSFTWPNFDESERQFQSDLAHDMLMRDTQQLQSTARLAGTQLFGSKLDLGLLAAHREQFQQLCAKTLAELVCATQEPSDFSAADDAVFLNSWIPSHLHQVSCAQKLDEEFDRLQQGENLVYRSFLAAPENETDEHQAEQLHQSDISSESESEEEELEGEAKIEKFTGKIPPGVDPKEWKRKVKEEARERRKTKTPKHIKRKNKQKAKSGSRKKR